MGAEREIVYTGWELRSTRPLTAVLQLTTETQFKDSLAQLSTQEGILAQRSNFHSHSVLMSRRLSFLDRT